MTDRKRTKEEERAYTQLMLNLLEQEQFLKTMALKDRLIPKDWGEMDRIAPCVQKKTKVTVRLDDRMVRWFRGMGTGWHGRVEAVLMAYMQAVVSKEIETSKDRTWEGYDPI